jgi:hypothetical protein
MSVGDARSCMQSDWGRAAKLARRKCKATYRTGQTIINNGTAAGTTITMVASRAVDSRKNRYPPEPMTSVLHWWPVGVRKSHPRRSPQP